MSQFWNAAGEDHTGVAGVLAAIVDWFWSWVGGGGTGIGGAGA